MSIFGWSYPPGCSGPPDDYEGPCEVCGNTVDRCTCPECPVCGCCGDPSCYVDGSKDAGHWLVMSPEQREGRQRMLEAQHDLAGYWDDYDTPEDDTDAHDRHQQEIKDAQIDGWDEEDEV